MEELEAEAVVEEAVEEEAVVDKMLCIRYRARIIHETSRENKL